jgi:hypothetical protein
MTQLPPIVRLGWPGEARADAERREPLSRRRCKRPNCGDRRPPNQNAYVSMHCAPGANAERGSLLHTPVP